VITLHNRTTQAISLFLLLFINTSFASEASSIKFYVSNNTQEISPQTAYDRLMGKEQIELRNNTKILLEQNHLNLQKSGNILGVYQLSSDRDITADNTLYFYLTPNQSLSQQKIFSIAKLLAIKFKQESVAVFIPHQSALGEVTVRLSSHTLSMDKAISDLHQKLPSHYTHAFSLYLHQAKVYKVEWLGSKLNTNEIKRVFPRDKITAEKGDAFLVYQNGREEKL
jgi:hypothetical protein